MEKRKKYYALNEVLPGVIAHISGGNIHDQTQLENAWRDIAGSETTGLVFSGVKDGCVFITVDSPARLYQWKLRRTATLRRLKEKCPAVENIAFKIGKTK